MCSNQCCMPVHSCWVDYSALQNCVQGCLCQETGCKPAAAWNLPILPMNSVNWQGWIEASSDCSHQKLRFYSMLQWQPKALRDPGHTNMVPRADSQHLDSCKYETKESGHTALWAEMDVGCIECCQQRQEVILAQLGRSPLCHPSAV